MGPTQRLSPRRVDRADVTVVASSQHPPLCIWMANWGLVHKGGAKMNAPSRDPIASSPPTLNAEAQIGLSVVCAIRNRLENLVKALPSWLAQHEIDEILLVDWGSTTPVLDGLLARGLTDPRLRVLRVEGEDQWCLTLAYNLGFRMARFDRILKLDADICLNAGFFANHPLGAGQFYAGDWRAYGAG